MWTGVELLLVLLGVTVFGSMLLILAMGYNSIEADRRQEEGATSGVDLAIAHATQSLFAAKTTSSDADQLVVGLNEYLRQAQASAERFVADPSVEGLQREAHQSALRH